MTIQVTVSQNVIERHAYLGKKMENMDGDLCEINSQGCISPLSSTSTIVYSSAPLILPSESCSGYLFYPSSLNEDQGAQLQDPSWLRGFAFGCFLLVFLGVVSLSFLFVGATGMMMVPCTSWQCVSFYEELRLILSLYQVIIKRKLFQISQLFINRKGIRFSMNLFELLDNKIKLMSLIIDQERASQQFEKEFEIKEKLRLLQGAVFKNYTVKKSVSVLHPKSISPSLIQKKDSQLFVPQINTERVNRQNFPNVAVISFGNNQRQQEKQQEKQHSQSARTLSLFAPRVTMRVSDNNAQKQEKLLQKMKRLQLSDLKKSYQGRSKLSDNRDSQTILRKNTLFLVNCLKTRYKQKQSVHIGQRRDAANHMRLGNFSQKISNTQYQQRFEYMEDAKQRLLKAKSEKPVEITKVSRLSPLLPEPWETGRSRY